MGCQPRLAAGITVGIGAEQATILHDQYGVPSINGAQRAGVWFGAGYAQAQDRLVQLELVRRTVEATLSGSSGPACGVHLSESGDRKPRVGAQRDLELMVEDQVLEHEMPARSSSSDERTKHKQE